MLPHSLFAQCGFCSGGAPATQVVQTVVIPPTNNSGTTVNFNKFYDASGSTYLTCYSFWDTLTAISTSTARNEDPDSIIYTFNTDVNYTIKGPVGGGLNISEDKVMTYGPDSLAGLGFPGDSVVNGPDIFFNQKASSALNKGNTAPYTGSVGTVGLTITFGGGGTAIGGSNYTYNIKTQYSATFKLVYYICPSIPLATAIHDLTAIQNRNGIMLQWFTDNEQNNPNYEIQISTDGKTFQSGGSTTGNALTAGTSTKYQYQYNLDQNAAGTVYFRVKRTDASGGVSYSAIIIARPGGNSGSEAVSYQTYPNPATNSLAVKFNTAQSGRYMLELVNTAGQTVQKKVVDLAAANQVQLDLLPKPVPGLYFLRTTDLTHDKRYTSKILIQ